MLFTTFGNPTHKTLMLIHGLGVSYQVFAPLIEHLQERYYIVAVQVDGFLLDAEGKAIPSVFTSINDQVDQLVEHIRTKYDGHLDAAYGLSMGGCIVANYRSVPTSPSTTSSSMQLPCCPYHDGVSTPCATIRASMCGAAIT